MTTPRAAASLPGQLRSATLITLGLALAMLVIGQSYLLRKATTDQGKTLFLLGLALSCWVLCRHARTQETGNMATLAQARPWRPAVMALTLAGGFAFLSAVYAARPQPIADTALLWLTGMSLLIVALMIYRARAGARSLTLALPRGHEARQRLLEIVALMTIMGLAVYLRAFDLKDIPRFVHGDEAHFGIDARALRDGEFRTLFENAFQHMPRLTTLPAALIMSVWDDGLGALRLATVLTGILTLPLLYLLARMFVDTGPALLAVFLLAVARVDIHFSRQGMNNIQTAPLTVAAIYFLLRALRNKSISSALISGAVAGAAVYSYFSGRFIPLIIGCVIVFALFKDLRSWRTYIGLGLASAAAAAIVAAPMLGYYLADMRRFLSHPTGNLWMNNIAHVTGSDPTITIPMIWRRQLDRTFWSFNLYRDSSGQYGADATLLDPATSILFFIGLAICLYRWKETGHFMLLAWYVVTNVLAGLIVVGPPNAPRLTGLLPAVCLMAAIAIQRLWDVLKQGDQKRRMLVGVLTFVIVPAYAFASNYNLYFQSYIQTYRYEPQTEIGRYLSSVAPDATAYGIGGELDVGSAIVRLLAPSVRGQPVWDWEDLLPIRQLPTDDVFFFAGETFAPTMDFVRHYYPAGTSYEMRRTDGRPLFLAYRVSREDIAGYIGLKGTYTSASSGSRAVERHDAILSFQWSADLPQGIIPPFSAQWDGSLFAPMFGSYRLHLEGNGDAVLYLDDRPVLRMAKGEGPAVTSLTLAKGWHQLRLDYTADGGSLRLLWQQPGRNLEVISSEFLSTRTLVHGLLASYHVGASTGQPPVYQAIEPALFTQTRTFAQLRGWGTPYISVWSGMLTAPQTGQYTFAATALEGDFTLRIDGQTVLAFGPKVHELQRGSVRLSQGPHHIEVTFHCQEGRFQRVQLWWAPPRQELTPIPPSALTPRQP